jgi:PAS domain S-box-containing protein
MSMKLKLILSIYAVLFVIVTLGFTYIINQEINHRHNEIVVEAKVLNHLLSQDLVEILSMGKVDKAADITSRLQALEKVRNLIVYDINYQPVFYYRHKDIEKNSEIPENWNVEYYFYENYFYLLDFLTYQGRNYGYIFIQLDAKVINESINSKIFQAGIVLFVLLITSFILALSIQRYFSNPIQQLADLLKKTAETFEYSARLPVERNDEIGDLFEGFNNLQSKIEEEKKAFQEQQFAFNQHCIVGVTDLNGTLTYVNDLFVKISGYKKNELLGLSYKIFKSSFHDDIFFEKMYEVISSGNVWHGDICNKAKDGREYWLATTIVPLLSDYKKPISYIAIHTDITVQKATEANLARAQKMVNIGSWELDLVRNDLHWSAEIFRIFEIDPNKFEATYEAFIETIHPDDREMVNKAYTESLKNRQPYELEHRLLMKDGRVKMVKEQCETYFDDSGLPIRSVGVVHDISRAKQTEEALRRSQKMDAVGQLTGGVAHDFNNIMGIILGNVELLELLNITDENILKRIEPIKITAQRAAKLTKQLLAFSRRKAEQLLTTNINQQLTSMNSLIVRSITPEIEVTYLLADDLWLTKIDLGDFQDSILNMVINARDAMNSSGHLTIESSNCHLDEKYCMHNPEVKTGDYVQLIISDNGEGMTFEQQQHIFEPFYTTKAEDSGTGLGLAMVFGFVERSKGYIKVYSEQGIGTTFRIYLPRVDKNEKIQTIVDEQDKDSLPKGNEMILVVDDEQGLRDLACDSLRMLGYTILVANNGKKALEVLAQNPSINLLFTDVVMPGGVNGYELAEIAEEAHPNLKILLTSGYTQKAMARNGQARFDKKLLSKPYTRQQLANRIRELLD